MKQFNIRLLTLLLCVVSWSTSLQMSAQDALRHMLSVVANPTIAGTFNTDHAELQVGETIQLLAYAKSNFSFKEWQDSEGNVIARTPEFEYTMPDRDVSLTAMYEYNPANPENPVKNYWDAATGVAIVDDFKAGSLSNAVSTAIKGSKTTDLLSLTVAGQMTQNDYSVINSYANCAVFDISRVTGVTEVPSYAFDYTKVESVYLPASIEKMGYRAFYQCKQLTSLTVYAMVPPTIDSSVFSGIQEGLIVYVPAAAIAQYQDDANWQKFTILPVQDDVRNLTVSLPEGATAADFAQMWLELTNTKSGQKLHYVLTDRTSYTFANIIRNTSWNAVLRNQRGDVFGRIDGIEVKNEDINVTFSQLSRPQNVSVAVMTPEGRDVTTQTQITWVDAEGNYLAQSNSLSGLPVGYTASYRVALPQELAMQYVTPEQTEYVVNETNNRILCSLAPIPQVTLMGQVKDLTTKTALRDANVSVSQTFGGRYSKTVSTKTDANGNYSVTISNVPTSLAVSAYDYISQTIVCDTMMTGAEMVNVPDVSLKGITGAVITLNLTYTKCPTGAEDEETFQEWYSDYNNVGYSIYNRTKQCAISQYNVQYPQIVLLEEVSEGDELELMATSKTGAFMPIVTTATIDAEQRANAAFNIVELGKIQATFVQNSNASVVGILYDAKGKLVKSYDYTNASLTVSNLADGSYTLVSMGGSPLFNSIYDLRQLPQTGLVRGSDYVQQSVEVKSGQVTNITIDNVPTLNESALYYTGDSTSFTVNKPSIVAGNYLTLTGIIDFKSAYKDEVSNVNLIVDLPESCSFVEGSVMVGNNTSSYTLQDNRVTIPLAQYTDRVRFCIIPTLGGDYAPSALCQFDIDGESITQPIGSANYQVKDLSLNVPSYTADTNITINGTAKGKSEVSIYDNDVLIGKTTSKADGTWSASCELYKPFSHSFHDIYAKITTENGLELTSEMKHVEYDKNNIVPQSVTMISNYCTVEFDIQRGTALPSSYSWNSSMKDFTFLADFTKNDSTMIKNVNIKVLNSDGTVRTLPATFDGKQGKWVATTKYSSSSRLPQNVTVEYDLIPVDYTDDWREESILDQATILANCANQILQFFEDKEATVIEDEDDHLTIEYMFDETTPVRMRIENMDYADAERMMQEVQFVYSKSDEGIFGTYTEETDNEVLVVAVDVEQNTALRMKMVLTSGSAKAVGKKAPHPFISNISLGAGAFLGLVGTQQYWTVRSDFDYMSNLIVKYTDAYNTIRSSIVNKILAKCPDGSYKLSKGKMEWYEIDLKSISYQEDSFSNRYYEYLREYQRHLRNSALTDVVTAGLSLGINGIIKSSKFVKNLSENAVLNVICRHNSFAHPDSYVEGLSFVLGAVSNKLVEGVAGIFDYKNFDKVRDKMLDYAYKQNSDIMNQYIELGNRIEKASKKCTKDKDNDKEYPNDETLDEKSDRKPKFRGTGSTGIVDPSGFVYEGVFSNRLSGVTATCYYKEMIEDMYGDLHENIVKWNAEEYAQENPLFTDENGFYRWDVPQGLWQVKFEKEGYETTYSEWLPVPPPQLDVNIAMTQLSQPEVKSARTYEDAVEIEFDKYMIPATLTEDNIYVIANGNKVEGSILLLNEEVAYEGKAEKYASKIRFNANAPFAAKEVTLTVANRVKSYAGIQMQESFSQTFDVEQEVKSIETEANITVTYDGDYLLTVKALPAAAAAGKTLIVRSSSSMIATTDAESYVLDKKGEAQVLISGELPGTTGITFTIDGYDLSVTTMVNVQMPVATDVTATPTASIASGTTVERGTKVVLSCETPNATIYYTLDGSCPCNEDTRLVYTAPIVINESVTIKAMAVAPDMEDSEIAEFSYTVKPIVGIDEVTLDETIKVYPLPVRDKLNVTAGGELIKSVTLVSTNGSVVAKAAKPETIVTLDVSTLAPGIYFINVATEDKKYSRKIMKVE